MDLIDRQALLLKLFPYEVVDKKNCFMNAITVERTIMKMPKKITGGMKANTLVFDDREFSIDGIFMLRESVLPSALVGGLQTENGHVAVDRNMQTNLKGCFAAGDCTGRPYQYAKAAGEGNIAAHSVCEYLAQLTK